MNAISQKSLQVYVEIDVFPELPVPVYCYMTEHTILSDQFLLEKAFSRDYNQTQINGSIC